MDICFVFDFAVSHQTAVRDDTSAKRRIEKEFLHKSKNKTIIAMATKTQAVYGFENRIFIS